jgi:hypothetical protein
MSRNLARPSLALAALLCAGQGLCDQPAQPSVKLTAQEVAVRIEKAGKDPALLLEVAAAAEPARARQIREQVKQLLQALTAADDRAAAAARVAPVLARSAMTGDELKEALGPARAVARQVLNRRTLEQWHYDAPLPLTVTFERPRGQEARIHNAEVNAGRQPR